MKKPIEVLMEEHRLIERVLDALDRYAELLTKESPKAGSVDLGNFVSFIRGFADCCHHGKEEDILFEEMANSGFPRDACPLAVMLADHAEARRLTSILAQKADKSTSWTYRDRHEIAEIASAYTALLREHIQKEDNVLYVMAETRLSPEILRQISEKFDRFEKEKTGTGEHEKLHRLAQELVEKYAASDEAKSCCHHKG